MPEKGATEIFHEAGQARRTVTGQIFPQQTPLMHCNLLKEPDNSLESALEDQIPGESPYVIITAARNEEAFIGRTIEAVLAQTVQPLRWLIVSDGSTDRTDEIIQSYAVRNPHLQYARRETRSLRSFANKNHAFDLAYQQVKGLSFEFIGNLDADIEVPPKYYESLLDRFGRDPKLGLASGFIDQAEDGIVILRDFSAGASVPHGAQLVRRRCFEQIGGYLPLEYGGEDWCAELSARMNGWLARSFTETHVIQLREADKGRRALQVRLREGKMDYFMGSLLLFEVLKCGRRLRQRPYVLGALARLSGYLLSYLRGLPRKAPDDVISFLRKEQWGRLRSLVFMDQNRFDTGTGVGGITSGR